MAAKRNKLEETNSAGAEASSSTTVWQTYFQHANSGPILQTADELAKSNPDVGRILREYADTLLLGIYPNIDGRGDSQTFIKQKRPRTEGEKIDRSQDARILHEFYQHYREENHLDELEHEDSIHRHSDTYDEDSTTLEQQTEVQRKICNTARILNAVIDALTKDGQTHELNSHVVDSDLEKYVGLHAVMEKLDAYMKPTKVCLEGVEGVASPKFNKKQCAYLFEKLEAAVESAKSFIEELKGRGNEIFSTTAMNRWAETFKLLLVSSERVEGLIRECGKDDWIRSALTLAHVKEHVSSIGLSLEFCKVALRMEQGVAKILTVDEVGNLNETESERVKNTASVDATSLIDMASAAADSSSMARCLRGKLRVGVEDPYFDDDSGSQNMPFSYLFKFVNLFKEKQIGAGSSARVFSVPWLGINVAKKTFEGSDNEEFWREAKVLSRLHHPNITSVFCCNKNKRECSIIMELMDGSLYDLLRKRTIGEDFYPFSDLEGLDLMLQVGEGVNYLHEEKIVHRDLKSGNILVKMEKATDAKEKYMQVKVADFGLSKTKDTSISYSTMTNRGGTSRWMAPEIIRCIEKRASSCASSIKHNFKGDIFSLGMVFWEILVGEVPFQNERSEREVKNMVLNGLRPSLPEYCSPRLAKLIKRCWSHEPAERPRIGDVCTELKYLKYLLLTSGFSQECSNQRVDQSYKVKEKKDHDEYGALVTAVVNVGVNTVMPPTSGLPQPVQSVPPLGPPSGIPAIVRPPQQPSGALNYTKLWEGILAAQRNHPVPICKLEGYRQTSASEKLAADWPPTIPIVRLIAQEYMNSKEYQGKAELLVFRPLSQHGFLVQLAEKKLCAVIQLPSQTLLLASTDKPGRMIGMLFPGDIVIFKPNVSTSAQQPTGAVAPLAGTGQAMGQPLGQSNFTQGQLQGQMNPQQLNPQQMGAQQLNPQQMNPQQMNPQQQLNAQQMGVQQMNPQQMSVQQMNSEQMNPQQMSGQQINPQQMGVQQINPQMSMQQMGAQQMNPQQTRPQIMPGPVRLQGPGYNLP